MIAATHTDVLLEALEPFARFADALSDIVPDTIAIGIFADGAMRFGPSGGACVGDLRRALSVLAAYRAAHQPLDEMSRILDGQG